MSTLNYYSSRSRASARQDKIRNELSKSSLYLADNGLDSIYGKPSYDSLKKGSSYLDTGGRMGRTRTRDHSSDFYVKPSYRSSSMDLSAPTTPRIGLRSSDYSVPSPRIRDRSMDYNLPRSTRSSDFSINGIERLRNRTKISTHDDDDHSQEYKNIMAKTDTYLNTCKDVDINKDREISRDEMSDMINNSDLSTKTINAINKEIFNKEGKDNKKNYNWRKEMEGHEEEWEKLNARSNSRTRDSSYKDTYKKTSDYDNESKKKRDSDIRTVKIEIKPIYGSENEKNTSTPLIGHKVIDKPSYESVIRINNNKSNNYEEPKPPKKGSWRKDIARYEEDLELKKLHKETQKKIETYNGIKDTSNGGSNKTTNIYNQAKADTEECDQDKYSVRKIPIKVIETKSSIRNVPIVFDDSKKDSKAGVEDCLNANIQSKATYNCSQSFKFGENEQESNQKNSKPVISDDEEQKTTSVTIRLNSISKDFEQKKIETFKPTLPKSEKIDAQLTIKTSNTTLNQANSIGKVKLVQGENTLEEKMSKIVIKSVISGENKKTPDASKVEKAKVEIPKSAPKWKKPAEPTKAEEQNLAIPKSVPKWKKPSETIQVEEKQKPTPAEKVKDQDAKVVEKLQTPTPLPEPKSETTKPVSKWKTPTEPVTVEEVKIETPKSVPKWKKPSEPVKVEAAKVETPKSVPKWKKPSEPVKVEEAKVETPKSVPKWKKPSEPVKVEEAKVETPKSLPKWKKPSEAVKVEEAKVETPKSVPKWKKPSESAKAEDVKALGNVETVQKQEPKWKKPSQPVKVENEKVETPVPKPAPKWKKPSEPVQVKALKVETPKPFSDCRKTADPIKDDGNLETSKSESKWKKPVESVKVKEENVKATTKSLPKLEKSTESAKLEEPKTETISSKVYESKSKGTLEQKETKSLDQPKENISRSPISKQESKTQMNKSYNEETIIENAEPTQKDTEKVDLEQTIIIDNKDATQQETPKEEEKEEEEEDVSGMRAMRKETDNKFANMEAEFEAGRSKLAALRARIRKTREMAKASAEADAAADAARQN